MARCSSGSGRFHGRRASNRLRRMTRVAESRVTYGARCRAAPRRLVGFAWGAALCAWLCAWLGACGDGGRADSASASAAGAEPAAILRAPGDSACRNLSGRWDECNVRQRLERAGLAPRRAPAPVRQPIFSVPGISYAVGRAELQVYLYRDSAALARDVARIDTLRVQGRDAAPIAWADTPTLITSNNLAAVLLSDNGTQVERVRLAVTAGLPAPRAKQ